MPYDDMPTDRDSIAAYYFAKGFAYSDILMFLAMYHGISLSIRQLHRILRASGLRRNSTSTMYSVVRGISEELCAGGHSFGYRAMQARLRLRYGISTDRETVRISLGLLDPQGVAMRRRRRLRRRQYFAKGPDFLYHIDGWDKLKRFGLCVHGCIDGFSRRIMWLEAGPSNNNPYVICSYFADCVTRLNGLPCLIRTDHGTENGNVELMQRLLRADHTDDRARINSTFLYGRSTSNQRIEAWWSKFPALGMTTWIDHFRRLEEIGIIDTASTRDIECIKFCFLPILRNELNMIKLQWNTHYIRLSRHQRSIPGKPDVLYHLPEMYGTCSYLKPLDRQSMQCLSWLLTVRIPDCRSLYSQIFNNIMRDNSCNRPTTLHEATDLLVVILDLIEQEMQNI